METSGDAPSLTVAIAAPTEIAAAATDALAGHPVEVVCEVSEPEDVAGACVAVSPVVAVVGPADGSRAWRDRIDALTTDIGGVRVVAILGHDARVSARRLCSAGVDGIVPQAGIATALLPTVLSVSVGQVSVPRAARLAIAPPIFSAREKQVLALIVMGLSNGEIAAKLWLAESTVKSHLASAFGKLGVRSRNEAAALIMDPEQGLGTGILPISPAVPNALAS
ncbi:MAG: LuxR C-terminal-related transcriptional regulator [Solirubrobacteraceae bacterium]